MKMERKARLETLDAGRKFCSIHPLFAQLISVLALEKGQQSGPERAFPFVYSSQTL